jgi:hypothetical protein
MMLMPRSIAIDPSTPQSRKGAGSVDVMSETA